MAALTQWPLSLQHPSASSATQSAFLNYLVVTSHPVPPAHPATPCRPILSLTLTASVRLQAKNKVARMLSSRPGLVPLGMSGGGD